MLYPNPLKPMISIQRLFSPETNPAAIKTLLDDLPSEPAVIEKIILGKITYRYDWEGYGMPLYFPTVEEVL